MIFKPRCQTVVLLYFLMRSSWEYLFVNIGPLRIFVTNKYCPGALAVLRLRIRWKLHLCGEAVMQTMPEERFSSLGSSQAKKIWHISLPEIWAQTRRNSYSFKIFRTTQWPKWRKAYPHQRQSENTSNISKSTFQTCGGGSPAHTSFWLVTAFTFKAQMKSAQ